MPKPSAVMSLPAATRAELLASWNTEHDVEKLVALAPNINRYALRRFVERTAPGVKVVMRIAMQLNAPEFVQLVKPLLERANRNRKTKVSLD